jgi:hypothetical protein
LGKPEELDGAESDGLSIRKGVEETMSEQQLGNRISREAVAPGQEVWAVIFTRAAEHRFNGIRLFTTEEGARRCIEKHNKLHQSDSIHYWAHARKCVVE